MTTFARPELLYLLVLVPLLGAVLLYAADRRRRAITAFGGRGASLASVSQTRQLAKAALALVALAAVIVAAAGPRAGVERRDVRNEGIDIVIAVDVSQSMAARDVEPDRLRAARAAVEEIGSRMAGSRVGLVLFAGQGLVRYPLTTDTQVLASVLDHSGHSYFKPQPGSSLRAALLAAVTVFPTADDRSRAVVVISDGEDIARERPPVDALRERGISIFALGVGTAAGAEIPIYDNDGKLTGMLLGADGRAVVSRLDETALRSVASEGGGRYWRYGEGDAVGDLAGALRGMGRSVVSDEVRFAPVELFQLFLAIALAALIAERLLSDRRRMPLPGALA